MRILILILLCMNFANAGDGFSTKINDPFEPANRAIYKFNYLLDESIFEPSARFYRSNIPAYGRNRIGDFVTNLKSPVIFVNSVLQGDVKNSFVIFWKFVLNSTFGLAGFYDISREANLQNYKDEDFGLTLANFGIGEGPYIMLPILGPSNLRDAVGNVFDRVIDPFNHTNEDFIITKSIIGGVHERESLIEVLEDVKDSFDPYAALRSLYIQRRDDEVRR